MSLPIFHTEDKDLQLMQNAWSQQLNPVINSPLNSNNLLKSISLVSGSNIINHKLGRKLQGFYIVRQRASASIYDTQDSNPTPNLTLQLTTNNDVVVDLVVF